MHVVVVWLCSFDLGKRVDVVEAGRRLLSSGLAEALLTYDVNGKPQIEPQEMDRRDNLLWWMKEEDKKLLQEEYRKSGRIARLKLRGLKAKVLDNDSKVEAYLTIHRTGFAVLSFWLFVDRELEPSSIIKIEDPFTPIDIASLWPGLLQHLEKLKIPEVLALKETNVDRVPLVVVRNLYIGYVHSTILGVSSFEELLKKLRYPYFGITPVVGILDVDDSEKFVQEHLKELHGIIAEEEWWDWVRDTWVKHNLGRNLAYREGWHVYIGSNGALIIVSKEANNRLREILKKRILNSMHIDIMLNRDKNAEEELEKVWTLQLRSLTLDLVIILENLVLQEIMLRTFDYLLGQGLPRSIKELVDLQEEISNTLDEFLNLRIWSRTTAREWTEYGKKRMGIDELNLSIRRRLGIIESMIRAKFEAMINITSIMLALLMAYMQVIPLAPTYIPQWAVNLFGGIILISMLIISKPAWTWSARSLWGLIKKILEVFKLRVKLFLRHMLLMYSKSHNLSVQGQKLKMNQNMRYIKQLLLVYLPVFLLLR
jgi:hypothetical protein